MNCKNKYDMYVGDLDAPRRAQLFSSSGNPETNLVGATITYDMYLMSNGSWELKIDGGSAVLDSEADAIVMYDWQAGDTDTAGKVRSFFVVSRNGSPQTYGVFEFVIRSKG